jgi:hypothetical protein
MLALSNIRNALSQLTAIVALLLVFAIPAQAQSTPDQQNQEQALKEAVHRILMRGDMADMDSLARDTGLELHLQPMYLDFGTKAIITKNPDYTYASSLTYGINFDHDKTTTVKLQFAPVSCPHFDDWEVEWHQKEPLIILSEINVQRSFDWNDNPDLHVELSCKHDGKQLAENRLTITQKYRRWVNVSLELETSGGSCLYPGRLAMSIDDVLNVPSLTSAASSTKDLARELARKLIDVIEAGDIRNYSPLESIFDANFVAVPEAIDANLLVNGSARLAHAIPGLDSATFSYHVNDTGWDVLPYRVAEPKYLHSRQASFGADVDRSQFCLNPEMVENMAQGRGLNIIVPTKESPGKQSFSVINERNLINISFELHNNDCVSSFKIEQVTDAAHDLAGPLFIPANIPSKHSAVGLDASTKYKLDEVAQRINTQKYYVVDIDIAQGDNAGVAERMVPRKMSKLVRSYLIAKHVASDRIVIHDINKIKPRFLPFKSPGIYIDPSAQSYDLLHNPLPSD